MLCGSGWWWVPTPSRFCPQAVWTSPSESLKKKSRASDSVCLCIFFIIYLSGYIEIDLQAIYDTVNNNDSLFCLTTVVVNNRTKTSHESELPGLAEFLINRRLQQGVWVKGPPKFQMVLKCTWSCIFPTKRTPSFSGMKKECFGLPWNGETSRR